MNLDAPDAVLPAPTRRSLFDSVLLDGRQAEAVLRVIEAAPQVRRRYQFFVWMQNQLHALLPHQIAVCGAYQRTRKELVFEAFHGVAVPAPMLELLTDGRSELMRRITADWSTARERPLLCEAGSALLAECGVAHLLVHGVARPQRPQEIESLFVFAPTGPAASLPQQQLHLEMLLPHLHSTYLRMLSVEREVGGPAVQAARRVAAPRGSQLTERERQILCGVRDGCSNQQIGLALGISALTVKNHVQKILRKFDASNRAQAVARAMTLNLLGPDHDHDDAVG
jgi:transcriptional regulator EpsA